MFFTRSLRRKLYSGLAVAGLMYLLVNGIAVYSLREFGQSLADLNHRIEVLPRRAALDQAADALLINLLPEVEPATPADWQDRVRKVDAANRRVAGAVADLRRKVAAAPAGSLHARAGLGLAAPLRTVDGIVSRTRSLLPDLADATVAPQAYGLLRREAVTLKLTLLGTPDPQGDLSTSLRKSRERHHSLILWASGLAGLVLCAGLAVVRYGYKRIFSPLRELHRGARRVANGDFDHRVRLDTRDEIGELADAFNSMTDRFQEITADLDDRVRDQSRQLVRSERLAGIGFLSAGVAHEINNPLSAISMAAESLTGRDGLFGPLDERDEKLVTRYLGMIAREAERCRGITKRLLTFARGDEGTRAPADLNVLVEEVLEMCRHMSKFADRRLEFTPGPPCVLAVNGPEMKQVLLNLAANALEATEPGGTVRVAVRDRRDGAEVTVADDGRGMSPETLAHLFEPFYTRRADGSGTGLGLSITHRIVSDHGGTIDPESDGEGLGSTFRLRLPRRAVEVRRAA